MDRLPLARVALLDQIVAAVDPRVGLSASAVLVRAPRVEEPAERVVLVGHRASGKSRLLPLISRWMARPAVDLDHEIERRTGKAPRAWVEQDVARFRLLERETFASLPGPAVISVGGGFLSLHADLLADTTPVLVPVSFDTYRERLLADRERPRLRPHLTLEEEISSVFEEREQVHARRRTWSLEELLATTLQGGG